jgi:hypothetical protein
MCAEDQAVTDEWVCKIKETLGEPCEAPETTAGVEVKVEEDIVKPILIMPLASPNCESDWNYAKKGKNWQCHCSIGKEQSPINIVNSEILPLKYFFILFN